METSDSIYETLTISFDLSKDYRGHPTQLCISQEIFSLFDKKIKSFITRKKIELEVAEGAASDYYNFSHKYVNYNNYIDPKGLANLKILYPKSKELELLLVLNSNDAYKITYLENYSDGLFYIEEECGEKYLYLKSNLIRKLQEDSIPGLMDFLYKSILLR